MRMRNVPGAEEKVSRSACFIAEPASLKGKWKQQLGKNDILCVEIGSGRGRFITQLAEAHTEKSFVAIEKYTTVLTKLVRKLPESGMNNLAVVNSDAKLMEEFFETGEIDLIYLNFSDPWPKKKHVIRRLTYKSFLKSYEKLLSEHGELQMKTDNGGLFDYSLKSLDESGWEVVESTRDLHSPVSPEWNVMTEYEEKFSAMGHPIHWLRAKPRRGK